MKEFGLNPDIVDFNIILFLLITSSIFYNIVIVYCIISRSKISNELPFLFFHFDN